MKVTAIQQQVKRSDRFSVFVDEKYAFSFGQSELLAAGLKIGLELSAKEIAELKNRSKDDKLYDLTLRYIAIRPRSEWELRSYLQRKGAPTETIEKTLNKLSVAGYVDDLRFARSWVDSRRLLKATNQKRLRLELRQKQVPGEIIDTVLSEDTVDDLQVLKELIARKRKQSRYQDDLKLMQYLARQGFNYGDIKEALQNN